MNHAASISSNITAEVDAQTLALAERLTDQRGMTNAKFASEAIRRVAESDVDFEAFIQVGIDAAGRGNVLPLDRVAMTLDGMVAKHRA